MNKSPNKSFPYIVPTAEEIQSMKVDLENASDTIRELVREKIGSSAIGSRTTILEDGTSISVFYRPDTDTVGVAEISGSGDSKKIRDRKWSNLDVSNQERQERQVVRRDGRSRWEVQRFGFRPKDIKRIGRLITEFKTNEGIDG